MPDMGPMIYDTKTALILRRDLAAWQVANVAAFLAGGLTGTHGHLMGEPYRDGGGRPEHRRLQRRRQRQFSPAEPR